MAMLWYQANRAGGFISPTPVAERKRADSSMGELVRADTQQPIALVGQG